MRHYFQSKEYRAFVRTQRCVFRLHGHMDCEGAISAHHEPPLSSDVSSDLHVIPLCLKHHHLRHQKPNDYFRVVSDTVLIALKLSYIGEFLRENGLATARAVVKPGKRTETLPSVKPTKWQPINQSAKRGKGAATRPLNVPNYSQP